MKHDDDDDDERKMYRSHLIVTGSDVYLFILLLLLFFKIFFRFVDGETEPRFERAERADVGAGQVAVALLRESEQSGNGQHDQHAGLYQVIFGHDQDPGERPGGQPAPVPRRSIPAQVPGHRRRPPPARTRRPAAADHPHGEYLGSC